MNDDSAIDLFSGGGGSSMGLEAAGFKVIRSFELDEMRASSYRLNLGDRVCVADATKVDYREFRGIGLLAASPPCQEYSGANNSPDLTSDRALAGKAVVYAIEQARPKSVIIENVPGYRHSPIFKEIIATLEKYNYNILYGKEGPGVRLDAADYGVPQNRVRIFIFASRGKLQRPSPTHIEHGGLFLKRWVSWYDATQDLFPHLPDSELASWQIERLPEPIRESFLISGGNRIRARGRDRPSHCVLPNVLHRDRVVLIDAHVKSKRDVTVREEKEPSYTIICSNLRRPCSFPRILNGTSIKIATPRFIARLQTFPDCYTLPQWKGTLLASIIGNAVPPHWMEVLARQVFIG